MTPVNVSFFETKATSDVVLSSWHKIGKDKEELVTISIDKDTIYETFIFNFSDTHNLR